MAGVWPNLDISDLESRTRTYLNEVTASFFTQAELYRWLSLAVKDIAQRSLCCRRILDAVTIPATREVAVSAYKVLHVEYVPASGKPVMLKKIDPLKLGNLSNNGSTPQSWYEFGSNIGIEPLPAAAHKLRLYVADLPKIRHATWPIASFVTGWTEVVGHSFWTAGTSLVFLGTALNDENAIEGPTLSASTNYTIRFTVSGLVSAELTCLAGTTASPTIDSNGVHAVTLTSSAGTPKLTFNGKDKKTLGGGTVTVDDVYILKEQDFTVGSDTDQTEIGPAWQHLACLYATAQALRKDRKPAPATLIETIVAGEIDYLRQNLVEVLPDGQNSVKYL